EVIKNQTDFSVFDGQKWQGTLTELKPGEGYSYHAASAKSFTYSPVRAGQVTAPVLKMSQATTWEYNAHRYRDNMNIIARLSVEGQTPEAGIYTVGAFCGDECRGIGQYVDGRLFITVHGENAEDVIRFKAYENAAETERDINETMLFSDALKGTLDQPVTLSIKSLSLPDNPDPSAFVIYPSPVRDKLYIAGLNGEMIKSIKILTVTGSIILATDSYNKGEGINVSALSDGNYLLAIGLEDGVIYRKFIKLSLNR
ncbi:MAG: T9SS type A sorting domain-containing protein, partial [Dysgonamonadaceae bacterium]|nr:T9SS type A sorting domain-containing protein [Dysgonamonadaceae bacterium]